MAEKRRRPLTREEIKKYREQEQLRKEKQEQSRELSKGPIDLPFCLLTILLTGIGLIMLLSASFPSAYYETKTHDATHYFVRQGLFALMGIFAMLIISKINYQRLRGAAKALLFISIIMLIMVKIPGIGIWRNGARRWLGVGELLTFQPSEIAKVAIVVYFADSISRKKTSCEPSAMEFCPMAFCWCWLAVWWLGNRTCPALF